MKKIDLHGKNYEESEIIVSTFIENNLNNLPIKIITGNSINMKRIVIKSVKNYNLSCNYQNHHNLGALIITNKY